MKCNVKDCPKEARYQENEYTKLCPNCWYETTKNMFDIWHKWFKSDQSKKEPNLWVYDSDKIIG